MRIFWQVTGATAVAFMTTGTSYKEGGVWKLHISDEFIQAFMGNMDSDAYEEELTDRIAWSSLRRSLEQSRGRTWSEEAEEMFE